MPPTLILLVGMATILGAILLLRLNAFLALIIAAIVVSLLAPGEPAVKIARVAEGFGRTAGSIGVVIALASIAGKAMVDVRPHQPQLSQVHHGDCGGRRGYAHAGPAHARTVGGGRYAGRGPRHHGPGRHGRGGAGGGSRSTLRGMGGSPDAGPHSLSPSPFGRGGTPDGLRSAVVLLVHAAFGGSTNLLLHIPAIAHAAGLRPPTVEDWIRVNRATPRLVDALPNGPRGHPTVQVFMAGGVPEVMLHLRRMGLLHGDVLTVTGDTLDATRRSPPRSGISPGGNTSRSSPTAAFPGSRVAPVWDTSARRRCTAARSAGCATTT